MYVFLSILVSILIFNIPSVIAYKKKKKYWRLILGIDLALWPLEATLSFVMRRMLWPKEFFSIIIGLSFTIWLVMLIWSLAKSERITPRIIGIVLLILGSIVAVYAMTKDTVYESYDGYIRHDSQAAEQKTNCLIFSGVVFVIGLALLFVPQGRKGIELPLSGSALTPVANTVNVTDELDKLFALKQKGAITEDEYETRKQQLLKS